MPFRPDPGDRFAVLISGRGSNMEALLRACDDGSIAARCAVVISNVASAPGLRTATSLGVPTVVVDHRAPGGRGDHDQRVLEVLSTHEVELICLAGYMRVLSPRFIAAYPNRILNIHPSLLPAFPGLEAHRQALEHGVRISGCTVHFVDEAVDHGPIVAQAAVEVRDDDTPESLAARILEQEHRLYVEAVRLFFQGRLRIEGRRVRILPSAEA